MDDARPLFTWAHISDLHFGHPNAHVHTDQKMVLSRLHEDIGTCTLRDVPAPNAVFVTGDVAFSGGAMPRSAGSPGEYEEADAWFGSLACKLNLEKSDFFLVPGNHDVQREPASSHVRRLLAVLRDGKESIDTILSSTEDAILLHERFSKFRSFAASYGPESQRNWGRGSHWIHEVSGLPFGLTLVGLNTALSAQDDSDRGRLVVGRTQLSDAITARRGNRALSIVLTHHPFDWCRDSSDLRSWMESVPCLHLSGHIHENSSSSNRHGSGTRSLQFTAGAAHASDNVVPKHGYNMMSLMRRGSETLVRVWPRRWADGAKAFRLDPENVPDLQQFVDFPIDLDGNGQEPTTDRPSAVHVQVKSFGSERPCDLPKSILATRTVNRCDLPPFRAAWVGRENELTFAADSSFRVVAITGMGGQGKSVLAAEHIERGTKAGQYDEWDWRDCREEGDTLLTHLVRIVVRFGSLDVTARELTGLKAEELALMVSDIVLERSCVLVFDNVDHYVNVDSHTTIGALDVLVRTVLRRPAKGRLIMTCRPKIQYDDETFFHLPLSGLSSADTLRLFIERGARDVNAQARGQIERACQVTNGHPLWLNLIAVQVAKHGAKLRELLDRIEQGRSTELPMRTLDAVWSTLRDEEKSLLRLMAEIVRPESEQHIGQMAEEDMSWNRFGKCLRSVRSVDLIVTKRTPGSPDLLELHPLIREYIRRQFGRHERRHFIARIASVWDGLISKLKPKLAETAEFAMLDIWTARAELALNAGLYEEAIAIIQEIEDALRAGGYAEEFTRIALRILGEVDWNEAIANDYKGFGDLIANTATTLAELGRCTENETILARYERMVISRGARYIALCNARCYSFWYAERYEEAIDWGTRGVEVKTESSIDTASDCEYNLALARRDGGDAAAALPVFLSGGTLAEALAEEGDFDAATLGNVGRCLWKLERYEDALSCYRKSAQVLERDARSGHDLLNQGYIRLWIGEALERLERFDLARCFFLAAERKWKGISPPRAVVAAEAMERVVVRCSSRGASGGSACADAEVLCRKWIRGD